MGFGGRDGSGGFEGSVEADQASSQASHVLFSSFSIGVLRCLTTEERERDDTICGLKLDQQ